MVYAAILAGGAGTRMNSCRAPKQFLPLGGVSILEYATRRFIDNSNIDKVAVAVPKDWLAYTETLFGKGDSIGARHAGNGADAGIDDSGVCVVQGGVDRNSSLMAVIKKIEELYGINNDDIIVTHDAVRPFVTQRIINDNVEACRKFGAAVTAVNLSDTPMISGDGETISEIPIRSNYYAVQTPQTFSLKLLKEVYSSLTEDEIAILTDAGKIFVMRDKTVRIVKGESFNIKITTPFDYTVALAYLEIIKSNG